MSFGRPEALLALLALVGLGVAWAYAARRRAQVDRAYGGAATLRRGRSRLRAGVRGALLLAAVTALALAAAQPRWGARDSALTRRGIDVVIALDISRSMLATDVAPSRAAVAANGLRTMLGHQHGDRVGLVTFGGSAFARSPLTLDRDAVADLVAGAQREGALVQPGTDLGAAIMAALRLLNVDDPAQARAIVLISDGEQSIGGERGNLDAAIASARRDGVRVYSVAAGTERGAAVPPAEGERGGAQPVSRADRETLGRIAAETGGELREVGAIAGLAVEFARLRQTEFERDVLLLPIERFQWFVGAALALLLAHALVAEGARRARPARRPARVRHRAGAATLAVAVLALAALLASVGCSGSAAYREVERGNDAYARGEHERALEAYRRAQELAPGDANVDYNIGNALHRLLRYEDAVAASTAAVTGAENATVVTHATYALGSHAYRRDQLEAARDAFIGVLLRDPSDGDAKRNLELVLRTLDPQSTPPATPTPAPPTPAPGAGPSATPGAGPTATPGPGGSHSRADSRSPAACHGREARARVSRRARPTARPPRRR